MAPSDAASSTTQPFSDSSELLRRVARATAGVNQEFSLWQPQEQSRDGSTASATELDEALKELSLTSLPDARLIVTHYTQPGPSHVAAVPLSRTASNADIIGVVQRTQDVCFTLWFPFQDPSIVSPSPRHIPLQLLCHIYYNPANDDCVLVNESLIDLVLTRICPAGDRRHLSVDESVVVQPGLWRISMGSNGRHHLVDFLILRRRFAVTVHEAMQTSKKRSANADCEGDVLVKRRRGQDDTTEILLAPTAKANGVCVAESHEKLPTPPARDIVHVNGTPLLDLVQGEMAVVHTNGDSSVRPNESPAEYSLRRLSKVAETPSASLFTGHHSSLTGSIVAKVIRYTGKTSLDIVESARSWQREKEALDKLRHPNVICLRAFDGRLFAMYVERLPPSLQRGTDSPFAAPDAHRILRDISAALAYLATQNVVHNDIKPANIAYSPERGGVLLDFGLATPADERRTTLGGSPWYVPPDLITQQTRGSPGDVWALGVTMLYVLSQIQLPERTAATWRIRQVPMQSSEARQQMIKWLSKVALARDSQSLDDLVGSLVYRMLEPDGKRRIDGAQISAAFEA